MASPEKCTTADRKVTPTRPPPPSSHTTPPSVKKHFEFLQPLSKEKVRWFYQEEKKWIPFNGRDSLKIETIYRSLPSELQSPSLKSTNVNISIELPVVRGSLFEVNILNRECSSIFWKENNIPVMRGTWFKGSQSGNWEPLNEKQACTIEEAHCEVVRSLGTGTLNMNASNNIIHQIKIGTNRIEWHEISQVYVISESAGSRFVQKIGFNGAAELHRGYEKDCDESDDLEEISHIIFLIHGIGQMYCDGEGILHNRKIFVNAVEKVSKQLTKQKKHVGRIEYFPIEWRTKLKLDEGIIKKITPPNISSLRDIINGTTLDVLYYTSPLYKEEIILMLRQVLNSVYKQYTEKNPIFEKNGGKVSIIAHSLGSVIMYDVLSCWNSHLIEEDRKSADLQVAVCERSWFWGWGNEQSVDEAGTANSFNSLRDRLHKARLEVSNLEHQLAASDDVKLTDKFYSLCFKVENVFNVGSPLGVFLMMRGIRPQSDVEQHILPTSVCKRLFNIYDPADPLAYRLEPLIYEHYSNIPPVRVTRVCAELEKPKHQTGGYLTHGSWLSALFKAGKEIELHVGDSIDIPSPKLNAEKQNESVRNCGVKIQRIDYVLEQSMVEYLSAITSHQAYWQSVDFAKFVLQTTYANDDVDDESRNQTRI